MNNITKKTQTILFASLIAAMILPFSGMQFATAEEQTVEEVNKKIQNTMNTIDEVQNKIKNASDSDRKERLENRLLILQERLDNQIEKLTILSEPILEENRITSQQRNDAIMEEHHSLYKTDSEYAEAVDFIRTVNSSNLDDDTYWNKVVEALKVTVSKTSDKSLNVSPASVDEMENIRDVIRNDFSQHDVSVKLQQNMPIAQSSSCDAVKDDMTPVLIQPIFDYTSPNNNGIMYVYTVMYEGALIDSSLNGECVLEITLVYADEDIGTSNGWQDLAYDELRKILYGRILDIETMYVVSNESTGYLDRMSFVEITLYHQDGLIKDANFKAIHDGTNPGWYDNDVHFVDQVYPLWAYTGNPVVFVTTWNHALGEDYTSSTFPAYGFQLDKYAGTASRPMVENYFSDKEYESWYDVNPLP